MNTTIAHVLNHLPHSLLARARRSLKGASRLAAATAASVLLSAAAFAAVEVNQASTQAELESIRGIGPALSERILLERQQGPFKNWADLISRVRGVGEDSALKLSAQGLTVAGKAFEGQSTPKARKGAVTPAPTDTAKPAPRTQAKPANSSQSGTHPR